jgi:hypothetical protein
VDNVAAAVRAGDADAHRRDDMDAAATPTTATRVTGSPRASCACYAVAATMGSNNGARDGETKRTPCTRLVYTSQHTPAHNGGRMTRTCAQQAWRREHGHLTNMVLPCAWQGSAQRH